MTDGELSAILKALQLTQNQRICDKSREIYRKSQVACPSLGAVERCRPFVCVELACTELRHPLDRTYTIRYSASNKEQYASAYDSISSALRLDVHAVSLQSLVLQTGSEALYSPALLILNAFYEKYVATLTLEQKLHISKSDPALIMAAFIVTASTFKARIDKKLLLEKNKIVVKSFSAFASLIKSICKDELATLQTDKNMAKNGKRLAEDSGSQLLQDVEASQGSSTSSLSDRPMTVLIPIDKNDIFNNPEYKDYLKWKATAIQKTTAMFEESLSLVANKS